MKHRQTLLLLCSELSVSLFILFATTVTESRNLGLARAGAINSSYQKGQFIAAFDWSVVGGREYVWPFESMRPAPYDVVWMVVERVPRVSPEKSPGRKSISLSAYRALRVNGRSLPKPHGETRSKEVFRVPLEKGRLRFSFSVPSGYKLDPKHAIIRVSLHKVA